MSKQMLDLSPVKDAGHQLFFSPMFFHLPNDIFFGGGGKKINLLR